MIRRSQEPTKFTIVVPTRERCDTLKSTLQTCLTQAYDRVEIIISDNFSQDGTAEMVKAIKDPRIRYFNTGKRLSMSHNWEFALSQVTGGLVMFLGDDDGLLPNALEELDTVIQTTQAKAVTWMDAFYGWPNCAHPWIRNKLKIPLGDRVEWRSSKKYLDKLKRFKCSYIDLPMLYGFFVDYEVINRCRAGNGEFFRSRTPDIYSAIAIATGLDRYLYSYRPYALYGISQHSTGASFFSNMGAGASGRYIEEANIPFHKELVAASSFTILTAECLLQARDAGLPGFENHELDYRAMVRAALREAGGSPPPVYGKTVEVLLQICEQNGLGPEFVSMIRGFKPTIFEKVIPRAPLKSLLYRVVFDGELNRLTNIYEASVFSREAILKKHKGSLFAKERMGYVASQVQKGLDIWRRRNRERWGH